MTVIKVDNLKKNFNYYKKDEGLRNSIKNFFGRKKLVKEAVKDISFEIEKGEIVGFLGPNGAGKTTTLKMLSGILYPTSGKVDILGYTPWKRNKEFKKNFSIIMGQKNQLWWDLPANESFYLNKCIYELEDNQYKKTLDELVSLLDVKDLLGVQVRRLSLGERIKMEIIAALIHKPKILFLDEPTIGLDVVAQKNIRDFLSHYNEEYKATIILTSHYMRDIEYLCKRTIVIKKGELVYDGNISKIDDKIYQKKILKIEFLKEVNRDDLGKIATIKEFSDVAVTFEVNKKDTKNHLKYILDNYDVLDFNIEDVPLEETIALLYNEEGGVKNEETK